MLEVRGRPGAIYWVVFVIAIVATFVVASSLPSSASPSTTTTITYANQSLIDSLQSQNVQLQKALAAARPPPNATLVNLDTVSIYQNVSAGVVTVQGTTISGGVNTTILGSGFVVNYSQAYYIVTNFHVVSGVSGITVTFQNGDAYPAMVVGSDGYSDLAVLSASAPSYEFHPLDVVSSSLLSVGEPVAAIGNPFGLAGSMTVGIVSQLGRTISESMAGNFAIANVIQFSAPINPGNSGGPLLDASGAVVGITTATVVSSQGVGFAIPSDTILKELPFLIATGSFDLHPFVGISTVDMNYQLSKLQGTNVTYGVLIENTTSGGPAQAAGLKGGTNEVSIGGAAYLIGGDIIVSINGTKILNADALSSYLAEYAFPGQTLVVQIIRGGQVMQVNLVLGTRPPPPTP